MALFNYATRELSAKIVYYGPGLSGKTTNIEIVHHLLRPEQKGRLISLPTETDRTLFFDFLPLDLGQIKGFRVRFHLYTVPGQVFYNATRRLVLQGVDGVVFVADSQVDMMNSNIESLKNLTDNLATYGKKLGELPFVMQYNKRDLKNIASVADMNARINALNVPVFEGVAKDGGGVTETLVAISRKVFSHLRKTLLMPGDAAESEEIGSLADSTIREKFGSPEAESLEEISDIEEIAESRAPSPEIEDMTRGDQGLEFPLSVELTLPEPSSAEAPPREEYAAAAPMEGATGEAPAEFPFEGLDEIEIEIPEREEAPAPPPYETPAPPTDAAPRAGISVDAEGSGLTFLKFEKPYVTPEGHAVLPALFLDADGNPVRIRIRVSMEEGR